MNTYYDIQYDLPEKVKNELFEEHEIRCNGQLINIEWWEYDENSEVYKFFDSKNELDVDIKFWW